jgi:hypothetical protein
VDDVFANLGRRDTDDGDGSEDLVQPRLRTETGKAARKVSVARPAHETPLMRVPRRSPLQRYESELDGWFAELADEAAAVPR